MFFRSNASHNTTFTAQYAALKLWIINNTDKYIHLQLSVKQKLNNFMKSWCAQAHAWIWMSSSFHRNNGNRQQQQQQHHFTFFFTPSHSEFYNSNCDMLWRYEYFVICCLHKCSDETHSQFVIQMSKWNGTQLSFGHTHLKWYIELIISWLLCLRLLVGF